MTGTYPNITRLTLDMVGYNGGLHVLRAPEIGAEQDVKHKLWDVLATVSGGDLTGLDAWLGTLTDDQFLTVADGEHSEMMAILSAAPSVDGEAAADLLDRIYEHCI